MQSFRKRGLLTPQELHSLLNDYEKLLKWDDKTDRAHVLTAEMNFLNECIICANALIEQSTTNQLKSKSFDAYYTKQFEKIEKFQNIISDALGGEELFEKTREFDTKIIVGEYIRSIQKLLPEEPEKNVDSSLEDSSSSSDEEKLNAIRATPSSDVFFNKTKQPPIKIPSDDTPTALNFTLNSF